MRECYTRPEVTAAAFPLHARVLTCAFMSTTRIVQLLQGSQVQLLADWMKVLRATSRAASAAISDPELQAQCHEFIGLLSDAIARGELADIDTAAW